MIAHWLVAAALARRVRDREIPGFVVAYEQLVCEPARTMEEVCAYLEINFDPETVLTPTKVGRFWSGNSAARINFSQISHRTGNALAAGTIRRRNWVGGMALPRSHAGIWLRAKIHTDASCDHFRASDTRGTPKGICEVADLLDP